jgi:hypothetical protein
VPQPLSSWQELGETDRFRRFVQADLVALDRFCKLVLSLQLG